MMTRGHRDAILAKLIAATGPLDPAALFMGVFTAVVDHGLDTVIADLTVPTGAPGTRQAVTPWGAPYNLLTGAYVVDGPALVFRPASSAEACTVVGWYLSNAAVAGNLLRFGLLTEPVVLTDELDALTLIFRAIVDPAGQWDGLVEIDG